MKRLPWAGRKFSLRVLILLIAAIGVGMAVVRWNEPAARYRRTGDAVAFYTVLKNQLRNGDSIRDVSRLLGPGSRETDPKAHADSVSYARRTPSENPQGAQDTDVFISWKTTGWTITLQFRDGRLINHNPAVYPLGSPGVLSN